MQKTKFVKKIERDNRKYKIAKRKAFLRMKLSFGKNREKRTFSYQIFESDHLVEREKNALQEPFYFIPTDIILYDLIPKEKLKITRKGLIRLFKKCYTHKYLLGGNAEEDIDRIINGIDQTIHSGKSWYNVGLFDFAYDKKLDECIEHFEISFHNFSSSYAAIEMRIELGEEFKNELSDFIKSEYKKPGMCVHRYWTRNKKASGAKIGLGVSSGTQSGLAKSRLIYEQLEYVKLAFLKEISKFFPIMLYFLHKNVYGINVFETNISPEDKPDDRILASIGIEDSNGFYLSEAERLYISTTTLERGEEYRSDMMYVYNPQKIGDYTPYLNPHNKALAYLKMEYMAKFYRMVILKNLGIYYLDLISDYRNKVNANSAKQKSQKKLLQLKYNMSRDFYTFHKVDEELPVKKEVERVNHFLEKNPYARASVYYWSRPYLSFSGNIQWMWSQVNENYKEIASDLSHKIEISSELMAFSRESSNRRLTWCQLILAVITFGLLIFPDKALEIADAIRYVWKTLWGMV